MTCSTIRWCAYEHAVDVAADAGDTDMFAGQFEGEQIMI